MYVNVCMYNDNLNIGNILCLWYNVLLLMSFINAQWHGSNFDNIALSHDWILIIFIQREVILTLTSYIIVTYSKFIK